MYVQQYYKCYARFSFSSKALLIGFPDMYISTYITLHTPQNYIENKSFL